MITCFCFTAMILAFFCPGAAEANDLPLRMPELDSLACDISRLGYIPSGGDILILAASNHWYTLLSGVRLLPAESDEMASVLTDTSGKWSFYGTAPWTRSGDLVLVTAPSYVCLPSDPEPSVAAGSNISFRIHGYDLLNYPRTAISTPDLTVLEISPDSAGQFSLQTRMTGVYWIEVMQQTPSGPSIELLFPIVAGGTALDVLAGIVESIDSGADCPENILQELNNLRHSMGIHVLRRSRTLDSLASLRAEDLAFSGSYVHFGCDTGSLPDILPAEISVYGENIGRGRDFQEAWSMILISPFHLQTCLSEAYTHAGLSGAVDSSVFEWQLVLVQIFASKADEQ